MNLIIPNLAVVLLAGLISLILLKGKARLQWIVFLPPCCCCRI